MLSPGVQGQRNEETRYEYLMGIAQDRAHHWLKALPNVEAISPFETEATSLETRVGNSKAE